MGAQSGFSAPPRRFYKRAEAQLLPDGSRFGVALDGRPLKTPAKAPLVVPTEALAEAIAGEWADQGETIDPFAMRLTRLAGTAIDRVAAFRDAVVRDLAGYAGTDLVCYRAEHPPELAERQHQAWQPLTDWAAKRYGARLAVTTGITPLEQPGEALAALADAVAAQDDFGLAALHAVTTGAGSLVIGLAVAEGRLDGKAAFTVSQIDESWQIERWGEDDEATRHRTALLADLDAAARFFDLLRPTG